MLAIVPFGGLDKELLTHLGQELAKVFHIKVGVGKETQAIDPEGFNDRRAQYLSSVILSRLSRSKPPTADLMLGVVEADLYAPELNFVFGESNPAARTAVIALPRLRQEFYDAAANRPLFVERALKEATHELAHALGLNHCLDSKCVMFFSNTLADTDSKGSDFCSRCKAKVIAAPKK